MRKGLVVVLVLLLVIGGGGFAVVWNIQAGAAKSQVEQFIGRINEKERYISYDGITTSGFPADVVVTIQKPHFTGRIDTALRTLAENSPNPNVNDFSAMPEWNADLLLDGAMAIRLNLLSDHYVMSLSGGWINKNTLGGVTESVSSKPTGDTVCGLKMERSGGIAKALWSFNLNRDGKQFAEDFRELDCSVPASTLSDDANNELLTSSGGARFFVSSNPQGANHQMRVYLKSVDAEITPAGDKWFETYLRTVMPESSFVTKFSAYGKQNVEIDFSFSGPAAGQNPMLAPFDFNLSKFIINNQVYDTNAVFQLASSVNGDTRTGKLLLKADSTFGEQYDAMIQDMVKSVINDVYKGTEPKLAYLKPYVQKYTQEQTYTLVAPSIPNFHSMGKMVQNIDVSYQGNNALTSGDFNIAALEISTPLYGVSGKGTGKMAPGQMAPASNVTLTCANCLRLVDDVVAYIGRLQKTISAFDEQNAADLILDPRRVEGFKSFLAAIAEPSKDAADKSSFTYTIISDGMMGITVSGKPMNEVMQLYAQYVTAAAQPAAGTPQPAQ